ncbi:MAG: sensor domain-containing diguanylate cyclase [Candidatus Xenobia bacterium]
MVQYSKQFVRLLLIWRWIVFALLISVSAGNVSVVGTALVVYIIATAASLLLHSSARGYILGLLDILVAAMASMKLASPMAWLTFSLVPLELVQSNFVAACVGAVASAGLFAGAMNTNTKMYPDHLLFVGILLLSMFAAWIYDLLVRQEKQATTLVSIISSSQELGAVTSLDNLLSLMVQEVQNLFRCHTVVCFLKDTEPQSQLVKVAKKTSPHPDAFSDFDPEVTPSVVATAMKEKAGVILRDFQSSSDADAIQKAKEFRGSMVTPLLFEGNPLGALFISSQQPQVFEETHFKLFNMLANQVALAVRNIQLQQTTQLMAITDSLSGLFTHGYFQDNLGKELVKAKYANMPVSLMILDVDFFKRVNDTYGHPQGDALLKQLGGVIKQATRPQDIVCRYGGDEFTATMLNTNRISAVVVAERIRQMVEDYEFVLDGKVVHITISGGVASFPEDAQTKKELVEASDHAMFEAKQKGRNRICFGT